MTRLVLTGFLVVALGATAYLQGGDKAREQKLQQAIDLVESKGDLEKAKPLFEDVAGSSDRALAARGLLHLAQAQERHGNAGQGLVTYRRIVDGFGGASESPAVKEVAAAARLRLAPEPREKAPDFRQVLDRDANAVSPDGQYLVFWNFNTSQFVLRDLASGSERVLSDGPPRRYAFNIASPSPDGRFIAYAWRSDRDTNEVRIVGREGGPSRLLTPTGIPVGWLNSKTLLVSTLEGSEPIVAAGVPSELIAVPIDGSAKRKVGQLADSYQFFQVSPDGRWLLYKRRSPAGNDDLFVMALDSGREVQVLSHPANEYPLGWLPSGNRILFGSDRDGTWGIWAVGFTDGVAKGESESVRSGTGSVRSLGITRNGELFFGRGDVRAEVHLATLGSAQPPAQGKTTRLDGRFTRGMRSAAWSPDGQRIAYSQAPLAELEAISLAAPSGQLAIQNVVSGEMKLITLPSHLQHMENPAWMPDGRSVIVQARSGASRQGLYQVEIASGTVTVVTEGDRTGNSVRWNPQPFPDGLRLLFGRTEGDSNRLVVRDLKTGAEEQVGPDSQGFALSPDGRWLALRARGFRDLVIQPATGGETRVLPRLPLPIGRLPRIVAATWSADSRALLVVNEDFAVWRVPTDGSPAQATGLMFPGNVTRISAHPDGRRLAISLQFTQNAVFVLENPGAMKGGGR